MITGLNTLMIASCVINDDADFGLYKFTLTFD
jgi:hypothetical protein